MRSTQHRTVDADGLEIFYRHAGDPRQPALLLLHGSPSSSHMFRQVIEPLAQCAYVVAPDLPGFGFSSAPPADAYAYTFANMADTIAAFTEAIGLDRYYLYVNDFGTPVGYYLATRHPERIGGLIVQNGNAHEAGLGPDWDAPKAYWADPSPANRAKLPEWLNFEGTRNTYLGGLPERLKALYPPELWHLDWERMNRPGHIGIHFQIFSDYGAHVARFPAIADYHREHQPPCLLLWGRHDPFFELEEIMAYSRVLDALEIHVFDGGHFLLETHHRECVGLIERFIRDVEAGRFAEKGTA
ncbi:alpha/beta fold hydrolase [Lysobacter silvisoli]|uniref:Alpha/beta hydrolase n=1 Tax=Lysobacter silvisoli TaxID=2293254 RepID=A0A371K4Z8_9GAMM|nr:alpha/beta hydrolase [Lysobacter silvisoli]RDZ28952.1 alpha/beta hydrolase [Lysobacter silvisoli]